MASRSSAARARPPRAASPRPQPRPRVVAGGARAIRWDRVGRVALLVVLCGVVALYIGPSITFVKTWHESKARTAELRGLQRENDRLRARRRALGDPVTIERDARRLGLVKPGERSFIVSNLPK